MLHPKPSTTASGIRSAFGKTIVRQGGDEMEGELVEAAVRHHHALDPAYMIPDPLYDLTAVT